MKLKMAGLLNTEKGKDIVNNIIQNMNSGSYSNNKKINNLPLLDIDEINNFILNVNEDNVISKGSGIYLDGLEVSVLPDVIFDFCDSTSTSGRGNAQTSRGNRPDSRQLSGRLPRQLSRQLSQQQLRREGAFDCPGLSQRLRSRKRNLGI